MPFRIGRTLAVAVAFALTGACASVEAQPPAPAAVQAETASLFLFNYRPGPAWVAGAPMERQALGPHAAFIRGLRDNGTLFGGGPFLTSEGGMAIVRAADIAEARALLAVDPAITSGVFVAEIEQWAPYFRDDAPLPAPP